MPKVTTDEIDTFIANLEKDNIKVYFCRGVSPFSQKGRTCKIDSGALIQKYLHEKQLNSKPALPVLKHHIHPASLRQRAKQLVHSDVGDIFGPEQISTVLSYDGFEAMCYRIDDEKTYQQFIIDALSIGQPVISFFDTALGINGDQAGLPKLYGGEFEHGAPVVGYYFDKNNEMQLIYTQWNAYYVASLHDMFLSTQQLQQDKKPVDCYKYGVPFFREKSWAAPSHILLAAELATEQPLLRRTAAKVATHIFSSSIFCDEVRQTHPPKGLAGSLANVLCIIKGDQQALDFLVPYKKYDCVKEYTRDESKVTIKM